MTLPVNTAIQIESRQPSAAEILAYAASRRDKWFSPQRAPVKRAEHVEAVTTRVYMTAPAERVWTVQYDAHVKDWREHLRIAHEQPVDFIKRRCAELGVAYEDVVGKTRKHDIIVPRHRLIAEVREQYSHLSLPHIGRLFGGRDHTSILFAIKKMEGYRPSRHRHHVHRERIIALHRAGFRQKDIAERAGCAASAVSRVLDEAFPNRSKKPKLSDHASEVEALFRAGKIYAEIAFIIGFDPSAVSKFIKLRGWRR